MNVFGNFFGKKEIVELMVSHSVAEKLYSEKKRNTVKRYGHILFRLVGYPISVNFRQRAKVIIKYLEPKKDEAVLDAGCGIGCYSFELATKYGCNVTGIDTDVEDIGLANQIAQRTKILNVKFLASDICNLNFHNEIFEKIIFSEVLEHIRNDKKALKELNRVLKKNGYLILSVPYVTVVNEFDDEKLKISQVKGGHVRDGYSISRLEKILNETGFEISEFYFVDKIFTKSGSFPTFLILYPISILDKLVKGPGENIVVKAKKLENL